MAKNWLQIEDFCGSKKDIDHLEKKVDANSKGDENACPYYTPFDLSVHDGSQKLKS